MGKTWKRFQVGITAVGMTVCMTAGMGIGFYLARDRAEKTAVAAAEKELAFETEETEDVGGVYPVWMDEDALYKEMVLDAEVAKEVCSRYGLDYDTVKNTEITREMRNYEEALWLIKDMGDCPLLGSGSGADALDSLESYICEIYAFHNGETVIRELCEGFGVDPDKAVISDLMAEQLIRIGEEAYEVSSHPKG